MHPPKKVGPWTRPTGIFPPWLSTLEITISALHPFISFSSMTNPFCSNTWETFWQLSPQVKQPRHLKHMPSAQQPSRCTNFGTSPIGSL